MYSYKTYAWTPALISKSSSISENPRPLYLMPTEEHTPKCEYQFYMLFNKNFLLIKKVNTIVDFFHFLILLLCLPSSYCIAQHTQAHLIYVTCLQSWGITQEKAVFNYGWCLKPFLKPKGICIKKGLRRGWISCVS